MNEKILHLHIPKVGGTTLRSILYEQYRTEPYHEDDDGLFNSGVYYFPWGVLAPPDKVVPEKVYRVLEREDLRAVLGHFYYGIHSYVRGPSTYIALLRDPADRLVSLYFLLAALPDKYDFPPETTFHEFATTERYVESFNDQTRRIAGREPGLGAGDPAVLSAAKENLRRDFSVVGTMERFDETLMLMKRRFNWRKPISYYRERHNPHRPLVSDLPRRTLDAIKERNVLDYELYDFSNEMLSDAVLAAGPEFDAELGAMQESLMAGYEVMARQKAQKKKEARALAETKSQTSGVGSI